MRVFEFSLPPNKTVSNIVRDLEIVSQKLDSTPEISDQISDTLSELDKKISNVEVKVGSKQQKDQPVDEDQSTDAEIQQLKTRISKLKNKLPENDPDLLEMENILEKLIGSIERTEKEQARQGFAMARTLSTELKAERFAKAKSLAERLGKSSSWANTLLGSLAVYDEQLEKDFLDLCNSGQGLSKSITDVDDMANFNLQTAINPKIKGIFDNNEGFESLLYLPFAEQKAGFGGGVGPGEALLAMLIPSAKRASPGDISVDGETWEIKSGSYSGPSKATVAWLDSSPSKPSGNSLRKVFDKSISKLINPLSRKKVRVKDNMLSVDHASKLADFRPTGLPALSAVFSVIGGEQQIEVLKDLYSELYPSVEEKEPRHYEDILMETVIAIGQADYQRLAKAQAKGGMLEYAIGTYNSPNFIIYNSTTHDIVSIKGIDGIIKSLEDESSNIVPRSATMGKSAKASAGIFLETDDQEFLDKKFGFERKRKKISRRV